MASSSILSPHGAWADNQATQLFSELGRGGGAPVLPSGNSRLGRCMRGDADAVCGQRRRGRSPGRKEAQILRASGLRGEGGQPVGASWNTRSVDANKKAANRLIFEKFIHLGGENG